MSLTNRIVRWRPRPPDLVLRRRAEMDKYNLALVHEPGPTRYVVEQRLAGAPPSDAVEHTVVLGDKHICTCINPAENDYELCVHMLFVIHDVLDVARDDPLGWQLSLLLHEMEKVLSARTKPTVQRMPLARQNSLSMRLSTRTIRVPPELLESMRPRPPSTRPRTAPPPPRPASSALGGAGIVTIPDLAAAKKDRKMAFWQLRQLARQEEARVKRNATTAQIEQRSLEAMQSRELLASQRLSERISTHRLREANNAVSVQLKRREQEAMTLVMNMQSQARFERFEHNRERMLDVQRINQQSNHDRAEQLSARAKERRKRKAEVEERAMREKIAHTDFRTESVLERKRVLADLRRVVREDEEDFHMYKLELAQRIPDMVVNRGLGAVMAAIDEFEIESAQHLANSQNTIGAHAVVLSSSYTPRPPDTARTFTPASPPPPRAIDEAAATIRPRHVRRRQFSAEYM